MPRKRTLWFRFYVEAIHDRKLRRQPPSTRWLWVVVLALARTSPQPGTLLLAIDGGEADPIGDDDLADDAALSKREVASGMAEFERLGMLYRDDDGAWVVAKWGERQFESDDTTQRTRKHRSKEPPDERGRDVPTTAEGTPSSHARATGASQALATEAETETELPPNPPPSGGPTKLNPRATGDNPRAQATRQQQEDDLARRRAYEVGTPEYDARLAADRAARERMAGS